MAENGEEITKRMAHGKGEHSVVLGVVFLFFLLLVFICCWGWWIFILREAGVGSCVGFGWDGDNFIISFTVASTRLCFGFVMKAVLIIQRYFS